MLAAIAVATFLVTTTQHLLLPPLPPPRVPNLLMILSQMSKFVIWKIRPNVLLMEASNVALSQKNLETLKLGFKGRVKDDDNCSVLLLVHGQAKVGRHYFICLYCTCEVW